MSAGAIRDFDTRAYGAAGFGQQDLDELVRRGHSVSEIENYINEQKREKGNQFGTGAAEGLQKLKSQSSNTSFNTNQNTIGNFNSIFGNVNQGVSIGNRFF